MSKSSRAVNSGGVRFSVPITTNNNMSLLTKRNVKQLKEWFPQWHNWQKRIVLCRIIEHCSSSHIKTLSTALEPILHLDFASSLNPLMAALHVEGSRTFKIQRLTDKKISEMVKLPDETRESIMFEITPESSKELLLPPIIKKEELHQQQKMELSPSHQVFLPILPQTHIKHKPSLNPSDDNRTISEICQVSSNPMSIERQIHSLTNLRLNVQIRSKRNKKSHMTKYKNIWSQREKIERYKNQLSLVSKWMVESSSTEVTFLLLELIKMCDKDLLGYLVQCVYHKLQSERGINSLSNELLLKIFSYLDAKSLCRCASVCRRWHNLTYNADLWRSLCDDIGRREGLEDIVNAIEAVNNDSNITSDVAAPDGIIPQITKVIIDWKQAYQDLIKLMMKLKSLVLKRVALLELTMLKREERRLRNLTSGQIRASLTLMEMLAILRGGGSRSTRDAISSLPESPIEMRKKHRSMMKKQKSKIINKTETPKEQVDFERKDIYKLPSATKKLMKTTSSTSCLVEVAIDSRPSIPSLPNPEGIELLVLAGYLSPLNRPRPGKIAPVTLLKRLENLETSVLCIQCDQRKIIAGCSDRLIRVYDIRSGRLVSILNGHKGSVQCLQFDDHKLVSGSWDTTCIVWDIVNFSILLVLTGHTDCVISLEFCNDILVTGSYDKTIMIWDTITWTCLRSIQHAHSRPITCLSFDGITIISGSEDKTVKLWDVTSAKCLSVLEHSSRITSLRFSKLLLVTACGDGSINLWNLINKRLQIKWEQKYTIAMSCIVDIFIDKGKVYTAASDGVLYEWDIAMGVCARTLAGHSNSLTALWVGDSKIVTTSYDQTICVWYTNKNYIETNAEEDNQTEEFYRRIPVRVLLTDNN